MIKRILLTLTTILFLSGIAQAQSISTTTCPGAGCAQFSTAGQGSIGIQITGTWSGTITFQGSIDNTNFVSLLVAPSASTTAVTTTTANGIWTAAVAGLTSVRATFTSYSSGTAVVVFRVTTTARNGIGGTSGGGGGSPAGSSGDIQYNNAGAFGGNTPTGTGAVVLATTPTFTTGNAVKFGAAGVSFTDDGDGAITLKSLSAGSAEDLKLNLDDTADTVEFTSSTGVDTLLLSQIGNININHDTFSGMQMTTAGANDFNGYYGKFRRSRGTIASPTQLSSGDLIAELSFWTYTTTGATYNSGLSIDANLDGAVSGAHPPTRLDIWTDNGTAFNKRFSVRASGAVEWYNTFTDASNYEKVILDFSSNVPQFGHQAAGTGTSRAFNFLYGDHSSVAIILPTLPSSAVQLSTAAQGTVANAVRVYIGGSTSSTATSGTTKGLRLAFDALPTSTSTMVFTPISLEHTINYSAGTPGAGQYILIKAAITETALPTGTSYLMQFLNGASATTEVFSVQRNGVVLAAGGTAIPAGGTAGIGYKFSSTSNFGIFFGSGAPSLSAAKGSIYLRSDGSSTSTRMYVNTDGGTTWTNVTTGA